MFDKMMTRKEQSVLVLFLVAGVVGAGVMVWRATRPAPLEVVEEVKEEAEPIEDVAETGSPSLAATSATTTTSDAVAADSPAAPVAVARDVSIELAGEVVRPGIYVVPEGTTLDEAARHAGGYTEFADTTMFNRLAHVIDGTKLTVPSKPRSRKDSRTGKVSIEMPAVVHNLPQYTRFTPPPVQPAGVQTIPVPDVQASAQPGSGPAKININTASAAELETLSGIGPKYAAAIIAYRTEHPFRSVEELMNVHGIGPKRLEAIRNQVTVGR